MFKLACGQGFAVNFEELELRINKLDHGVLDLEMIRADIDNLIISRDEILDELKKLKNNLDSLKNDCNGSPL